MSDIALNQSINQLFYLQTHNLNKGDISRLQTNLKLTVLSNTKLRHFWAQIVSWAPRHARKSFIVLAPGRGSQFTERWRHLTCCNEPNCLYGLRLRLFTEWWRHRTDSGAKRAKVRMDQGRRVWHWIGNPLNPPGVGWVNFFRWELISPISAHACKIWERSDGRFEKTAFQV